MLSLQVAKCTFCLVSEHIVFIACGISVLCAVSALQLVYCELVDLALSLWHLYIMCNEVSAT